MRMLALVLLKTQVMITLVGIATMMTKKAINGCRVIRRLSGEEVADCDGVVMVDMIDFPSCQFRLHFIWYQCSESSVAQPVGRTSNQVN